MENKMDLPNCEQERCERYRKALESISQSIREGCGPCIDDIPAFIEDVLAPTPEERGETPLFEGMPV